MARLTTPLARPLPVGTRGVCTDCGAHDASTCQACHLPSPTEFCARPTCQTVAGPSRLSPLFCDHR